ncbi:MAG TPA: FAD-binding oxidoreductase [Devosia sp.]|nr:FAD-binding oxidoreductase [Devosia sp.]
MSNIDKVRAALAIGFSGALIGTGDAAYEKARSVMPGGIDLRPGLIARPKTAADVQRVVNAARDHGIELAVRSGGHSAAGHSSVEGGLVLDLRDMNSVVVDAAGKSAWVETGATAIEVTRAVLEHELIVGFGDTGSVGVGGITLGGGVGYLARKWGLTIDSLLAAEIVTADGALRMTSADENADLFWALRGGGGNFGVVTRLKFALRELPEFTGGMLCLPATAETVAGFVAAASTAPEELSTIANIMPAPALPFLPKEAVGKPVILGMMAFAGAPDAAAATLAPFRALATPYADFVKPGPYTQMYPPEDPDYHPTAVSRTLFMDRVERDEAALMLEALATSDAVFRAVQIRVLGGAAARVPSDATAYAHRAAPIMVNVAAFWTSPEDLRVRQTWVDALKVKLTQQTRGAYVNFLGDEGPERVREAYPAGTWERLVQVKTKYDPRNLFRRNQNVAPAAA